jgi:hypothetical protein
MASVNPGFAERSRIICARSTVFGGMGVSGKLSRILP